MLSKQKKLNQLFEVRNDIARCDSALEAIQRGIAIAQSKLHSQVASVFLFSKEGKLLRKRIHGYDKFGEFVDNDWFAEESYEGGDSFTGKAVVPKTDNQSEFSQFGQPQWTNSPLSEDINYGSKTAYIEKLGLLSCAIAVPLNGRHRSYGVLEVINKVDRRHSPVSNATFNNNDVYWLSIIGMNIATAISYFRKKTESELVSEISRMLVEPIDGESDYRNAYQEMTAKLVGNNTCYKASILRLENDANEIEVIAKAGDQGISWEFWKDKSIKSNERISGVVLATGKKDIIEDIESRKYEFINIEWIRLNNLRSSACFPLNVRGKVIGTLSVFTGFKHKFFSSDNRFLENVAFLVAAFSENRRVIAELEQSYKDLDEEHEHTFKKVRAVKHSPSEEQSLHTYKNELIELQNAFEKILESSPGIKQKIAQEKIAWIEKRIKEITAEFSEELDLDTRVDINDILKKIVKRFSLRTKGKNYISFTTDYAENIPAILAKEFEIRELSANLISNAVKAIEGAERKQGSINITTELIEEKRIPYIQITVEDNGIGIKSDNREKIYEKGFSNYQGGTGMGLFFAKEVVEEYGGKIDFISTIGKGSKFFVKIPVIRNLP